MKKKLLTLEDLYNFYSTHKNSCHFQADDENVITVQTPAVLNFKKTEITDGLTQVELRACHTSKNLNNSSISKEVMENKFLPTFKNRPILGYIHSVKNEETGEYEDCFYDHRMHLDAEDNIVYDEIAVGIIPENNNARLEYDEEESNYGVYVSGYIFNDYTKASEIIEREQECCVSVELSLKAFSYDAKEKCLVIEDGYFSGVTILGKTPEGENVKPGMKKSNIRLKDFSEKNNSTFAQLDENKLVQTLERLNETLSKFNINNTTRKEEILAMNEIENMEVAETVTDEQFEEAAETTANEEVIEVESKEIADETPEDVVDESFEEDVDSEAKDEISEDEIESPEESDESDEIEDTEEFKCGDKKDEEDFKCGDKEDDEKFKCGDKKEKCTVEFTATCGDITRTYSLSLNEKIQAMSNLINETYGDTDCEWYSVEVFEDTKTVQFYGWCKAYRQSYKVKNDVYSLVGDRVELFSVWMTADEKKSFEDMKSNYSSISEKLSKYEEAEAYADKMTVFEDSDYSEFLDTEEFKALMSEENVKAYSKEELHNKAELVFAKLIRTKQTFAHEEKKTETKKPSMFAFARVEDKSSFLDGLLKK